MAAIVPASATTLTFKVWPVGYSSALDQDDIILEVKYLNSVSGITRTTVYNTAQTYTVGQWNSCSVTFTPSQAGVCYFNLYVTAYEAGDTILIDPIWSVS